MNRKNSKPNPRERRFTTTEHGIELRAADSNNPKIVGYAALFAPARTQDMGGWVEEVSPTAFASTLKAGADVRALFNHDANFVLGRTPKTLTLSVDNVGLRYEIDPPPTQWAKDLLVTMRRADVSQSSYGFICTKDSWRIDPDGTTVVRTIEEAQLFDVSVVTFPATESTSSSVRTATRSCPADLRSKLAVRDDDEDDSDDYMPECDEESPDFDPEAACDGEDEDEDDEDRAHPMTAAQRIAAQRELLLLRLR